jgi:glycosyltransferase involved in cell wall biosynthesis
MMTPAISIIIPVFNGGSRIRKTLLRLGQCHRISEAEIIVINDGSTDNTADVIEELRNEVAVNVIHKDNGGPGSARNVGGKNSTGKLIMFLGDDTAPSSPEFLVRHIDAHASIGDPKKAVLGKIVWPADRAYPLTLTEYLIQGEGQQQFGFRYMEPMREYGWPFFYTSNISFHRELIENWESEGFSNEFYLAAFEDGEFAYRLSKKYPEFGIIYCPSAVVEHDHPYTLTKFISRQINCGQMMDRFLSIHPELTSMLLPQYLIEAIEIPQGEDTNRYDNLIAVVEGIRAFCELYDQANTLGTENWHAEFINASLSLFTYYGYILSGSRACNQAMALSHLVNEWTKALNQCAHRELFGQNARLFPVLP